MGRKSEAGGRSTLLEECWCGVQAAMGIGLASPQ